MSGTPSRAFVGEKYIASARPIATVISLPQALPVIAANVARSSVPQWVPPTPATAAISAVAGMFWPRPQRSLHARWSRTDRAAVAKADAADVATSSARPPRSTKAGCHRSASGGARNTPPAYGETPAEANAHASLVAIDASMLEDTDSAHCFRNHATRPMATTAMITGEPC